MPGIDGLQTLEQLRHLKPGLKVVMLSCVNDTRKVVQAMRLGAIDYLTSRFRRPNSTRSLDSASARPKLKATLAKSKSFATTCFSLPPARR